MTHVSNEPLTTVNIEENAPGLLRNSIDERIVKIRPMSTPIDQLSRCGAGRSASAMTVEYYTVDTKPVSTTLKTAVGTENGEEYGEDSLVFPLEVKDDSIFEISETVLIPEVSNAKGEPLVFYVTAKESGSISAAVINPDIISDASGSAVSIPTIPAGSTLVRMGRAATELDVQTAQFATLPRKSRNNCQIFKMQVEQSTLARLAEKEVGWNFNDQEEAAIIDMRMGMEKSFLFGSRGKIYNSEKNEYVYLTGGIWNQAGRNFTLNLNALKEQDLVGLCSAAFTGNNGSKRKILLAGTGLMEALSKLELTRVVRGGETRVKWGIEFKEFVSNFGTLYVLHSEIFDQCGHKNDGFVLDPNYMTKYVHIPFEAKQLDLRSAGQRNTDAVVLTEASCVVLRYPNSHLRVIGSGAQTA